MARNGSGTYTLPAGNPVVTNTVISSTVQNNTMSDIATALTNSLAKDGQTTPTANIPLGGNKLTGVAPATDRTDAATLANVQDGTGVYVATVGGTADVITISPSPAITAYAAGQLFSFIASGANTTNVTVNVSGVGAKAITKNGTTALAAGDIPSGFLVTVRYDGTRFQVLGAISTAFNGGTVSNATTFSADVTMSGSMDKWAKGADVASATALPLITDGNYFDVTGTTTVTSFNTVGVGTWVRLHFDGALILTHNATDLVLPGGANITTAAGDEAEFIEYASGDWRCTSYTQANGAGGVPRVTTSVAVTTGTSVTLSSAIPVWAKRIKFFGTGIGTNGVSPVGLQLNAETTSYVTYSVVDGGSPTRLNATNILPFYSKMIAAGVYSIEGELYKGVGNQWFWRATAGTTNGTTEGGYGLGDKTTSGTLASIVITMSNGTDAFDGGSGQVTLVIEP